MPLSIDEVKHIATLARLELDESELAHYCQQLSAILDHIAKLQELDTENVPATSGQPTAAASLRPDEPRPGLEQDALLMNAPESAAGLFKIPPVFDNS